MDIFTGRVNDGKVELPSDVFPEGSEVTVLRAHPGEPFQLTPEQVAELKESLEQVRRGEYIDGDVLLAELRSRRQR